MSATGGSVPKLVSRSHFISFYVLVYLALEVPDGAVPRQCGDLATSRHRRRHGYCAGIDVPVLKMTASARTPQQCRGTCQTACLYACLYCLYACEPLALRLVLPSARSSRWCRAWTAACRHRRRHAQRTCTDLPGYPLLTRPRTDLSDGAWRMCNGCPYLCLYPGSDAGADDACACATHRWKGRVEGGHKECWHACARAIGMPSARPTCSSSRTPLCGGLVSRSKFPDG